jgi:protein-S-isoprenylcysteine O-methyltransferase Ste14
MRESDGVAGRRALAAAGTTLFLALAPGTVAGLVPLLITRWDVRSPLAYWGPLRVVGAVVLLISAVVILQAFARFVVEGIGTPAPVAPTDRLVVGGLYRYVRNPMYLAVTGAIVGQALLLGQPVLLVYGLVVTLVNASFVHWYEEPTLRRQFGAEYDAYCRSVPGWWPRLPGRGRPASSR